MLGFMLHCLLLLLEFFRRAHLNVVTTVEDTKVRWKRRENIFGAPMHEG